MCNVHEETVRVHSNLFDASHDLDPSDLTDRDWLQAEAADWRARASADDFDFAGLVASVLEELVKAMAFQGQWSARDYARIRRIDLDQVRLPLGSRSTLADALATRAAWYLHLDSWAGSLAAHAVLWQASLAEELGSQTVEDLMIDEAAYRAVCEDAIYGELCEAYAVA